MKKIAFLSLAFTLILFSCNDKPVKKYKTGHFPEIPVNMGDINSVFDDYNSDINVIYYEFLLSFSSNRNTMGNTFDFVRKTMVCAWDQENGTFLFEPGTNIDLYSELELLIDSANSTANEFGPYSFGYRYPENCYNQLFLYASDVKEDFDIFYSYSKSYADSTSYSYANSIGFVNSSSNELYPSFYGENFYFHNVWGNNPENITKMVYCSDKNGQFDIYQVDLNTEQDIVNTLSAKTDITSNLLNISSAQDDKCPFVNGKLLVFSSNREGGYGGYDLYYSQMIDGEWSTPENFGDTINTEFDEYRPVTLFENGFDNNLMIFSSNRDGGKGGFDLYYVGIKQMIE